MATTIERRLVGLLLVDAGADGVMFFNTRGFGVFSEG